MNSPALRKPKNPVQAAAQSILLSALTGGGGGGGGGGDSHTCLNLFSTSAVIGRRGFGLAPVCASSRFSPARTYSRRGMSAVNGLPRPW